MNYEINKLVKHEVAPVGTVRRMSVAVLVDGKPTPLPNAETESEQATAAEFVPWEAEELARFEQLAKHAVGFDAERGDEIAIINAPFRALDVQTEDAGGLDPQLLVLIGTGVRWIGFAIAALMFARFVAQPLAEAVKPDPAELVAMRAGDFEAAIRGQADGGDDAAIASRAAALAAGASVPGLEAVERPLTLQEQVDALTGARTDDSVKTIRSWMTG